MNGSNVSVLTYDAVFKVSYFLLISKLKVTFSWSMRNDFMSTMDIDGMVRRAICKVQ